jgi:hypothetical protein
MKVLRTDELAEWRARRSERNPEKVVTAQLRETEPEHTELPARTGPRQRTPLPERDAVAASMARIMLWLRPDGVTIEPRVRSLMRTRRNIIGDRSYRWVVDNLEDVVRAIVIHDMNLIYKKMGWAGKQWRPDYGGNGGNPRDPD